MKKLLLLAASIAAGVGVHLVVTAEPIIVPTGPDAVANGQAFQAALNGATCGDVIVLQAGATYATEVLFIASGGPVGNPIMLPNHGDCRSNPIVVESSQVASLAEGIRVNPTQAASMPKVITNTNYPVIEAGLNAYGYRLIGLEITNSPSVQAQGGYTPTLVSGPSYNPIGTHPSHITIERSYIHPDEDVSNPASDYRAVSRGVHIEGAEIVVRDSHISGFTGWMYGTQTMIDSENVLMIGGPGPLRIINNFLEAWFNNVFTGGGGSNTTNQATVESATLNSAVLSQTANLAVGDLVAFAVPPYANLAGSGTSWTVGAITGINGNTVNFTPTGPDSNSPNPPNTGGIARWKGIVLTDVEIRGNTFSKPLGWAKYGQCKSFYEVKMAAGLIVEGNRFIDGPGGCNGLAITARNQYGDSPWTTVRDVVIRNNIFQNTGNLTVQLVDDQHTLEVGSNVAITNNLMHGGTVHSFIHTMGGSNVAYSHNTIRGNSNSVMFGVVPQIAATVSDNLVQSGNYWLNCTINGQLDTCWPGLSKEKNLFINVSGGSAPSYTASDIVVADAGSVGFENLADCDSAANFQSCALAGTSPYKGQASDGTDPGVDMVALVAALNGTPGPPPPPPPPPPPGDTEAPSVFLAAGKNGNKVAASAWADDNVGVTRAEFYVDGVIKATDTTAPYTATMNLPGPPGSQHSIMAKAYDAAGNVGESQTIVLVK